MKQNLQNGFLARTHTQWLVLACLTWFLLSQTSRLVLFYSRGAYEHSYFLNLDPTIHGELYASLIRSFFSDIIAAMAVGITASALVRFRLLAIIFLVALAFLSAFNFEHIRANQSHLNILLAPYAFEKTFLLGSVLTKNMFYNLLLSLAVMAGSYGIFYFLARFIKYPAKKCIPYASGAFLACAFLLYSVFPMHLRSPNWIQANLFEDIALQLFGCNDDTEISALSTYDLHKKDLSGKTLLGNTGEKQNILLVMIEGMSAWQVHEKYMPHLYARAQKGLNFRQFTALQRQTNRGLYVALCNDFPNIKAPEAKADLVWNNIITKTCLPEFLKQNGYHTAFIQSADLGYMSKEKFGEKIGFLEIIGKKHYDKILNDGTWGADDITLFAKAEERAIKLSSQKKPWFISILNSSTHHPYNIPPPLLEKLQKEMGNPKDYVQLHKMAFRATDLALDDFLESLERKGLLKDTLVIITSDEVNGEANSQFDIKHMLAQHHMPLVVFGPDVPANTIDEEFLHLDIPLSVTDYLGFDEQPFWGRSIFRNYDSFRPYIFANTYFQRMFFRHAENQLLVCATGRWLCSNFRLGTNSLRSENIKSAMLPPSVVDQFKELVHKNDRHFESDTLVDIAKDVKGNELLLGDLKLHLPPNKLMRFELVAHAKDSKAQINASVRLNNMLNKEKPFYEERIFIPKGQSRQIRFEINSPRAEFVWFSIRAIAGANGVATIERLRITQHKK